MLRLELEIATGFTGSINVNNTISCSTFETLLVKFYSGFSSSIKNNKKIIIQNNYSFFIGPHQLLSKIAVQTNLRNPIATKPPNIVSYCTT